MLASSALAAGAPEVVAGHDRLDRPVRWVHVGEIEEFADLLEGGELILATALPARREVEILDALVEARAAGLVLELGPRLPALPHEVLARARSRDFPLVVLRSRVRFVEVTEQVHRMIVAEQYDEVEFARQVHETFTRLSLENADADTIVATAADLTGTSVLLEDLSRSVLAFRAVRRPAAGLLADWESRSRAAAVQEGTGIAGPEGWLTTPVGGPGRRWGRLVMPNPQSRQTRLAMVLERAAQALELGRMVERDRGALRLQARGGLLADLVGGRLTDPATAAARAEALGLPRAPAYVAVVAHRPERPGEGPVAEHGAGRDLVERVEAAATGLGTLVGALVGTVGGTPDRQGSGHQGSGQQVGILLALPGLPKPGSARTTGRGPAQDPVGVLAARLTTLLGPGEGVRLGVAEPAETVVAAGAGLRQAAHVAEVAAALPGEPRPYYRLADVRLHGLLALIADDPRVQSFVEAELGPLLAYESRPGATGDLLDLLRAHVAAGGNKTRLAVASHRSRAGVYKKLAQLERILGTSLEEPSSFRSVSVALLAYDAARRR